MDILTTMITPYKANGQVDFETAEKYVEWYYKNGIDGIFAVCQSSEIFYLTLEERVELNRRVYRKAKNLDENFVVVSSGHISDSFEEQVKELNAIYESGTDALILITNRLDINNEGDDVFIENAMVMSCDVNDDLLNPENWSFSEPLTYKSAWEGTVQNGWAAGTIEGTLCLSPKGELMNIMRYNIMEGDPPYGLVLAYKVNTKDPDAPLTYSHSIKMSCNNAKFMIKYDEESNKYYSIVSRIDCEERAFGRNLLSLMSSTNLENWEVVCDLIDKRNEDVKKVSFQYVDFEFEGDDIIFLCRTSINNAHDYHDANYSTFHRIENFRKI